ncbi:MAG TPA: enoyl-CoA hydratase-related protein, partial [Thermoplasmata archaeon]
IDLMVTGRTLTPNEALEWGLVNRVWDSNVFMDEVMKYAKGLCYPEHAGRAVALIKRSVVEGMEMSIKEGLALERELQNRLFAMNDAK